MSPRLLAWGPVISVVLLLAILWGLVLGYSVVQEGRFVQSARQQLRLINNAAVVQTRSLLASVEHDFDVLQHWLTHPQPEPRQDATLGKLLEAMARNSDGVLSVALLTDAGQVVPIPGASDWVSGMPAVKLPAAAQALNIGEPTRTAPDAPWQWPLTRRLPAPVGDVAGLVAWVDLTRLSAVHEHLREKPAGAISITTSGGLVVLRTPFVEDLIGRTLARDRPITQVTTPSGWFEHNGALTNGQPRLASFEQLGNYPLTVVVSQEVDEILAAFRTRRKVGIGALVVISVCALAFSAVLTRSRRAMRRSQAQFEAVSGAFPLGLFMTDTPGATLHANEAYFQTLGLPRERMAWGWTELLDPAQRDRLVAQWREAATRGHAVRSLLTFKRPDGREVMVSVRTAPMRVDGQLIGQVGSLEDVTERIQQQRAQRMLTAIFEQTTDVVAQVSAKGQLLYLNPAGRALLALGPDQPIDQLHYDDFLPAHRETQVRDVILPAALATGLWLGETSVLCGDGREIDVSEMLIVHRDDTNEVETYSVVMRDITQALRARAELLRSESVLKIVAATLPVQVSVLDSQQTYLFTNDAFAQWAGLPQGSLVGRHVREALGAAEHDRRRPYLEAALGGQRVVFESRLGGNQYFETTYIPFRDAEGQVAGLVAVSQDITTHKRQHQELLDASLTDALTGALNRAGFDLRVPAALEQARAGRQKLALLFVDLDRFKPVNDEHGHATGDALLGAVAQRLKGVLRPSDLLARLGGDEFAVVLPSIKDEEAARTVAHKIVSALAEPFDIGGKRLRIGASVGLALARAGGDTTQSLTERADKALYRAKRAGRGRFEAAHEAA